jgi:AraC family transcriptional regulator of adaptative response / DNA-3-methyladenine glycosylase II
MSENGWTHRQRRLIVVCMDQESRRFYRALSARDSRFDGLFFVGVTSTRIYCRPICPARTPRQSHCRFFPTPQHAEREGFRPCLRCRPELAPGSAPVDDAGRIARLIVERLEEGPLDGEAGLEQIAQQFELSSRQIRRIVSKELGVPPIQLLLTRRLLLAKQLLTETTLPVTEVAFASGFASLRRFNDAFGRRYGMPPTRLRRSAAGNRTTGRGDASTLQLAYRPRYDWKGVLAFLRARALTGVEHVTDSAYSRTVRIGKAIGWLRVTQARGRDALEIEIAHSLMPVLPAVLGRLRALFDLDARPDVIARHLRRDARLASAVKANPGLRVPGAFKGFELGVRAILGQQVTVRAATTIAGRFVEAFGDPVATPMAELTRLTPEAAVISAAHVSDIARHGIVAARARSIIALAKAQEDDGLCLDGAARHTPEQAIGRLAELPGIGPWTAHYIAMRALRWPDAFPKEDVAVRNNLGGVTASEAEALSQGWRPWRSYAVMHIWGMRAGTPRPKGNRDEAVHVPELRRELQGGV